MSGESTESKRDQDNHDDKGGDTAVTTPGSELPAQEKVPLASDVSTKIPEALESPGALEGDLKQMVQRQVEYYFSRENLMSDHYLNTQMDRDQYVPVAVIAGFNQVKRLTMDPELVKEAIRSSDLVQLDETGNKVRANSKRMMLLVRGIPEGTSHEEVVGLFRDGDCPPSSRCELARSDAWYIYFDSEEDAQKAYRFLREVVQEYKGSPLHVRLKEKVFQQPPGPQQVPAFSHLSPRGPVPFQHPHAFPSYMPRGPPMYLPNVMAPWPPGGVYDPAIQPFANGGFPNPGPPSSGAFPSSPTGLPPRFNPVPGGMSGRGGPFEGGRGHHHAPHQSGGPRGRHRPPYSGRDDSFGPHGGRGRRRDDDHRAQTHFYRNRTPQNFELAANQFPPLPGPEQVSMGLPAEEPGTNGRGSDVSKATYSKVTKNSSTPNKPDVALPGGEARQQQPGGVTPVELSKALSDGTEQKTVKATPKESPNQAPPQQQSTREGGPRQAQGNPPSSRGNSQPKSNNRSNNWKSAGGEHRSGGGDHRSGGGEHRSSGGDHRSGGGEHRSAGGDHRSGGGDHRSGGGDHRSGGGDHRSGGGDHRTGGGDHRSGGGDHRSGGGDHRSNEYRNRSRPKERKPGKGSPRHSPKPNRHSTSAPPTPSAGTTPEKMKQEAPLPGPDSVLTSYAAVTQRPKPSPKQGTTTPVENSNKDPSLAQSPSKQEASQTCHPDKQTGPAAVDTGQPARKQKEEDRSSEAGNSSPLKEDSNPSDEQNH